MDKLGVAVVGPGWAGGEHIKAYLNNPAKYNLDNLADWS